jgi:hypothetical protein
MARKSLGQTILEGAAGCLIGYALGEQGNRGYEALTPRERAEYRKSRLAHHGEVGCLMLMLGVGGGSAALAGMGAGLMYSDRKDANEWSRDTG